MAGTTSETLPRPRLLVVTSTFPRRRNDPDPPFVYQLCRRLVDYYDVHVLAPHAAGLACSESLDGMRITRFRYCWERLETLAYDGGILAKLRVQPLRWLLLPCFLVGEFLAIRRILREEDVDLIHAHWMVPQGLLAVVARGLNKGSPAVVCTSHGGDLFALTGKLPSLLKRLTINRSQRLTVVSRAMRDKVLGLGAKAERTAVIPMGVDLRSRFVPSSSPAPRNSLVFVGRLVEKKGLKYLLQALAIVQHSHPEAHLNIVGDGPDRPELQALVDRLGLESRVTFTGALPNEQLPQIYHQAEVAVFPFVTAANQDQEGFGLVLVEALGCQVAVVTSVMPAVLDIVEHENTALLAAQGDVPALAGQIVRLLDNPRQRDALAQRGRDYVLKRFDWSVIAERYRDLLEQARSAGSGADR